MKSIAYSNLLILVVFAMHCSLASATPPISALGTDNRGHWLFTTVTVSEDPRLKQLACAFSKDDGQSWVADTAPDAAAEGMYYPAVATDPEGNWLLAWVQQGASGHAAIAYATWKRGEESWSVPEIVHEARQGLVARGLQARAPTIGGWEVTSVLSSRPGDGAEAWFLAASRDSKGWRADTARLPAELAGVDVLASVAWTPLDDDRWYVGAIVIPDASAPKSFMFSDSVFQPKSGAWTPVLTPVLEGEKSDVPHILSLTRAETGEMFLVCGPGFSAPPSWVRYSHTVRPGGDTVHAPHTDAVNLVVPAASLRTPWYLDSSFEPGKLCMHVSRDNGVRWAPLISQEDTGKLAIATAPVADASGGLFFAAVVLEYRQRIVVMRRPKNTSAWQTSEPDFGAIDPCRNPRGLLVLAHSRNGTSILVQDGAAKHGFGEASLLSVRSTDSGATWSLPAALPLR